jgi:hypothetical protein
MANEACSTCQIELEAEKPPVWRCLSSTEGVGRGFRLFYNQLVPGHNYPLFPLYFHSIVALFTPFPLICTFKLLYARPLNWR